MAPPLATPEGTRDAGGAAPAVVRLRARAGDGSVHSLEMAVSTRAEAVRRAVARGFTVLAFEDHLAAKPAVSARADDFSLLLFSQELLALLEAGLNLTEALGTLLSKERKPRARALLERVVRDVSQGQNFSDVLARQPAHFPPVFVATVRASERTGDLGPALARYISYQLQFDTLRKKLITAALYPLMLLTVGTFVTLFLLGYVVPRFAVVYESAGRELPWMSGLLLGFGQAVHRHGGIAAALAVAAAAGSIWALARPAGRTALLNRVLSLPWLSRRADAFRLARFYRAMSLLLSSGIAVPRAMGMVEGLLGTAQRQRLAQARERVQQGQSLSAALLAEDLASAVAQSLLTVGERSGQLGEMLERTARFHDEEFARWVDWASRLLEPLLMLAIGVVIGGVVVLMYMPIFELAGSLQ